MTYEYYEKKNEGRTTRRCINGKITGCNKCVGYCEYSEHTGFLTDEIRKKHNCISKQCVHYIPKPKTMLNTYKNKITQKDKNTEKFLAVAQNQTSEYEGMKIIHAIKQTTNLLFEYVCITDDYPYDDIAKKLSNILGTNVILRNLKYDFDICSRILLS